MEFEYKVTVIVPVYNAEKNIDRTMQSLFQQTIAPELVEIILIDDGSTDGSPAACDRYAREYENVRVIHQENKGVSAARNAGIQAAQGKYLLYLDSDDTISEESLKNITEFFDLHYEEIDVVTYPLLNHYEDGTTGLHWRYDKYLRATTVYPLEKYPHIAQTTINVCVKNQADNQLFDTQMALVEDQLHNTKLLSRLAKIGFVKEAQYNYFRTMGSSSAAKLSPYYSFDAYILAFLQFLDIGDCNKLMKRYCESMILYNINWRLVSSILLPHHLSGQEYAAAMQTFVSVLNKIPNRDILTYPDMDEVHRYYLLSLKTENRPFVSAEGEAFAVVDVTGELRRYKDMLTVVTRSSIENGKLYLLAYVKCLVASFLQGPPSVYAVINGYQRKKLGTFTSDFNCYYSKMKTGDFPAFHFEIDLKEVKTLSFEVAFYGCTYKTKFWFTKTQGLANQLQYYLTDGNYRVSASKDTLLVEEGQYPAPRPPANTKITVCRTLMGTSHQRIWLYVDRIGVYDNAYYQFKHDIAINDGVKRYYIFDGEQSEVYHLFTGLERTRLVKFNSPRHKILYSNAEYVLTSFVDAVYYRPFDLETYSYYRGVCRAQIIYLQHGILHAKLPQYRKEKLEVDKVVISGEYERNLFTNECGFRETDLIPSGMPRLDIPDRGRRAKKKILYAPSWRDYLTRGFINRCWQPVSASDLQNSSYFKGLVNFLSDPKLLDGLREYGYSIELKLHPIFKMYEDIFKDALPLQSFPSDEIRTEEYAALITDFSSYLFDFAYLNRPIFNYVPDIVEFKAGLNSYRELYIPLEEGLGLFLPHMDEMVNQIVKSMRNGFSLQPVYKERMDKVFYHYEASHSDALYKYLFTGGCTPAVGTV